jgi:formylglycine-generating enzyme required for sulfatase activity
MLCASCLVAALATHIAWAEPPEPKDGPLGMRFVPLPKATFYMGWDGTSGSAKKTEIKEAFEIAVHTVTQGQWQEVMGKNPSAFSRSGPERSKVRGIDDETLKQFPMESVSWDDVQAFIKKLNEKEKGSGYLYRLPTEAEWEYACRGGATSEKECSFHCYFAKPTNEESSASANWLGESSLTDGANANIFVKRPTKVGSYKPNKLGLYDMHGNVNQWCEDTYFPKGTIRVYRGGSWNDESRCLRAGYRTGNAPTFQTSYVGFRLARVPIQKQDK